MLRAICCCSSRCFAAAAKSTLSNATTISGQQRNSTVLATRKCTSSNTSTPTILLTGGHQIGLVSRRCCAAPDSQSRPILKTKSICARRPHDRSRKDRCILHKEFADDRGGEGLERTQQQVPLGLAARPRLGAFCGDGNRG